MIEEVTAMTDLRYLQLLSRSYPTAISAAAEITNLREIGRAHV